MELNLFVSYLNIADIWYSAAFPSTLVSELQTITLGLSIQEMPLLLCTID
jgi:hypothetical protein